MTVQKKYRILCAVLVGILLLTVIGLLWYRADWRFRLWNAIRVYPNPDLEEVGSIRAEHVSLEEAKACEGVNDLLLLINSSHLLPLDYIPMLTEYNGALMHPEMVDAYIALRDAVEAKTGERIYVSSDYRSPEEQEEILEDTTDGTAAEVGASEHAAGLALDIYVKGYGGMSFIKSKAGREVARICGEYGFIIRYPEGKEKVTGISYEPWHLRYVGQPHASIIMDCGLTLEEYIDLFEVGIWYDAGDYFIGRFEADDLKIPLNASEWSASPDNTGTYIITAKKN